MNIESFLKVRDNISEKDKDLILQIEIKTQTLFEVEGSAEKFVYPILEVMYSGYNHNSITYIENVFLDFTALRIKTERYKTRIYKQIEVISEHVNNLDLINLYRNIVSDLFDPYINILVASFQFTEDKYENIQHTNLSFQEVNKYEFVLSRISNKDILNGYNSIVRNAVSHSGSEGIIDEEDAIVFRNIKRGKDPKLTFIKWSSKELESNIYELMNFIHGVDCAVEIFGFDISHIIQNNKSLTNKFIDEILTKEQRLKFHNKIETNLTKINNNPALSSKVKIESLSFLFFQECKKRNMEIIKTLFQEKIKTALFEVPCLNIDLDEENEVISRTMSLLRYGIVGSTFYKFNYETCQIQESITKNSNHLKVIADFSDLDDFGKENCGMYDLLYDCKLYINGSLTPIEVDFDKLEKLDYTSTRRIFPRKKR